METQMSFYILSKYNLFNPRRGFNYWNLEISLPLAIVENNYLKKLKGNYSY